MSELKLSSIVKTSRILANDARISREDIIKLSEDWSESQITFFKKIVRQGGTFRINGVKFDIKVGDKITNSLGQKDGGAPKMYGPEKE
jgi:hypothetical protein|tara:strand:- start:344 stop:607 length:264 start_codon:yes stop_codon:yes gene_type:complete